MKPLLKAILLLILILIPAVRSANVDLDKLDLVKFSISESDEKTMQFNDEEYIIRADSISGEEAKLTILPANYETIVGKDKKADIDINDDNEIDFSLTFVSSNDKTMSLEAKRIGAKKPGSESEKQKALPDAEAISRIFKENMKIISIVVAVLIIIILIIAFSKRKGNPEKFYRRAEALHMEAQEFHEDGDEETAAELYERAEELREEARSLERGGI